MRVPVLLMLEMSFTLRQMNPAGAGHQRGRDVCRRRLPLV